MNEERAPDDAEAAGSFWSNLSTVHVVNALVAFVFAVTGPIAVMLTVGTGGGMSGAELASWMFGAFTLNSMVSIGFSLWYRQPIIFLWSIPGIVLVGTALENLSFPEVVGAYYLTGLTLAVLGVSGLLKRIAALLPMPIVMGMVAGVFLKFGTDWIRSFDSGFWIAAPMTVAFFAALAWPALARKLPPVIVALAAGVVAIIVTGQSPAAGDIVPEFITPIVFVPEFTVRAALELVIPLTISVLFAQNNQGFALMKSTGHEPPVTAITVACGLASLVTAIVGTVSTCLAGPLTGITTSSGEKSGHYTAAVLVCFMIMLFGLGAPLFTSLILATPTAFIATLGGIALLRVLQTAFNTAFGGRLSMGGLVAFIVTVSGITFLNVGAPFWGLVFGIVTSLAIERDDFRASLRDG